MKRVHAVVGVLQDQQGRLLIAQRPEEAHLGGFWEFPGGKVNPEEDALDALSRELYEELGVRVDVKNCEPVISLEHQYPDRSILLDCYRVTAFLGNPCGAEGQPIRWIFANELDDYSFPKANHALNTALSLPDQYMICGEFDSEAKVLARIEQAVQKGVKLIQLRFPNLPKHSYIDLIAKVKHICDLAGAVLMIKGDPQLLMRFPGVGLHLTSAQLSSPEVTRWARTRSQSGSSRQWLAASCHNHQELAAATESGVDFVTFSPVAQTRSHPDQPAAGWAQAGLFVQKASIPVFLLGGMCPADIAQARQTGAQGIAAIPCYWQ